MPLPSPLRKADSGGRERKSIMGQSGSSETASQQQVGRSRGEFLQSFEEKDVGFRRSGESWETIGGVFWASKPA